MMTPKCPRLLNMINDFVLLRFRARAPEDLSAIEIIFIFILYNVVDIYRRSAVCRFERSSVRCFRRDVTAEDRPV